MLANMELDSIFARLIFSILCMIHRSGNVLVKMAGKMPVISITGLGNPVKPRWLGCVFRNTTM